MTEDRHEAAPDTRTDQGTAIIEAPSVAPATEEPPAAAAPESLNVVGSRNPRLIQIGALLIVACCALLPVVASGLLRAFARDGSFWGIVWALAWLAALVVAAVTLDRGLSRS